MENIEEQQESEGYKKVELTDALIKQVAALTMAGGTTATISKTLGLTRWYVKKIQADQRHIDLVNAISEEALATAQRQIRSETAKLAGEVMRVLRELLKKNNVDGLKIALKLLGLDNKEPGGEAQAQSLTVILPGQKAPPPDVVVKSDGTPEGK